MLFRSDLPAAMRYRTPQEVTLDEGLVVSTACVGETRTIQDRAGDEKQYTVMVAMQKKVRRPINEQTEDVGALLQKCDRIKDLFGEREDDAEESDTTGVLREEAIAGCYWMATEHEPRWYDEYLEQIGQFTSVILFTFRSSQ